MRQLQKCLTQAQRTLCKALMLSLCWLALGAPTPSRAEFILFPELTVTNRHGLANGSKKEKDDTSPALDLFYTAQGEKWRLLGEFFLGEGEAEVERLQLGWFTGAGDIFWLGKHHAPLGIWNTQYHHGRYLQTSISRPGITEYEDDGGLLPVHTTGLFWEGKHALEQGGGLAYKLSAGAGPSLKADELEPAPLDGLNEGRLVASAHLSYHPESHDQELGLFLQQAYVPGTVSSVDEVRLTTLGAHAQWQYDALRLFGELYWVHDRVQGAGGTQRGTFTSGYVQVEYGLHADWTVYGRLENTFGENHDPYVGRFPHFVKKRSLAGLRYELGNRQALKIEFAGVETHDDRFSEIAVQWSAAFP
ncbi:MAG: hypothetical protein C4528_04020 [Gammaproteobacteria bacterium]|nr:MAG: hypothetical protein C4528_04020 [Gammaproteobacteria bacterium]